MLDKEVNKKVNKKQIIAEILSRLEHELDFITRSAKAAHEAATHEESRAEDSHDTRGLESSYLAGAQAQRAAELQQQILVYKFLDIKTFSDKDAAAPTAVVEVESRGHPSKKTMYFIAPGGGGLAAGMKIQLGSELLQVLTPVSPLGEELVGRKVGDTVEIDAQGGVREYEILRIF
jgi:transcription elongation GreA/GreB family factor